MLKIIRNEVRKLIAPLLLPSESGNADLLTCTWLPPVYICTIQGCDTARRSMGGH